MRRACNFGVKKSSKDGLGGARLFARQTTFASHLSRQASGAYRMEAINGKVGMRAGALIRPRGTTFLPTIFTAYALNGENHVYRRKAMGSLVVFIYIQVFKAQKNVLPHHSTNISCSFEVYREYVISTCSSEFLRVRPQVQFLSECRPMLLMQKPVTLRDLNE